MPPPHAILAHPHAHPRRRTLRDRTRTPSTSIPNRAAVLLTAFHSYALSIQSFHQRARDVITAARRTLRTRASLTGVLLDSC